MACVQPVHNFCICALTHCVMMDNPAPHMKTMLSSVSVLVGLASSVAFAGAVDVNTISVDRVAPSGVRVLGSDAQPAMRGARIEFAGPEARALFNLLPAFEDAAEPETIPSRYLYIMHGDGPAIELGCDVGTSTYDRRTQKDVVKPLPNGMGAQCSIAVIRPEGEFRDLRAEHEVSLKGRPAIQAGTMHARVITPGRGWAQGASVSFEGRGAVQVLKSLPAASVQVNGQTKILRRLQITSASKRIDITCGYLNAQATSARCSIARVR